MKKRIIFFCFPGIGLLEQWLPILEKLKKKGLKIDIIFFNFSNFFHFEKDNYVHHVSKKIFENFYLFENNKIFQIFSIDKLIIKKKKILFNYIIKKLYTKKINLTFECLLKNYQIILYDTYFDLQDKFQLSKIINKVKKISLHHGVAFFNRTKVHKNYWRVNDTIYFSRSRRDIKNLTILNYTKNEINFWKFIYQNNDIKNIRIPVFKNDKKWVKKILKFSKFKKKDNAKKYFFLISRPANKKYLTPDQKVKIFSDFVNVAKLYKRKLIIKFHPKENKALWKNKYSKILKKNNVNYLFTEKHPYAVAMNSLITFTFFSELTVSMAYLKIPVIEYLPLTNFQDKEQSFLRDKNNNKIFDYRFSGLVYGVNNLIELNTACTYIINNRNFVVSSTYEKYTKLFSLKYSVLNYIVKIIIKKIL